MRGKGLVLPLLGVLLTASGAVRGQVTGSVDSAEPSVLAQGALSVPVRIVLDDVALDSVFVLDGPFVGSTAVRSDQLRAAPLQRLTARAFRTSLTVSGDAPPEAYRFDVLRVSPPAAMGSFFVRVVPGSSLLAPVSVTTVAVLHPRPGALQGGETPLYPRGVLTTTGTGPVTGAWTLDGVAFDRFMVVARAGESVEVAARVPVPFTGNGFHRLALAIDSPQAVVSEEVRIVQSANRNPLMRAAAPRPDAVTVASPSAAPPRFRWTPEPGAESYELLLSTVPREVPDTRLFRAHDSPWTLPESEWAALPPGRWYWTVRAVFPGRVAGEPLPWQALTVLPARVELEARDAKVDPETGDLELSWSGGVPGLLYRVEVLSGEEAGVPGGTVLDALTFDTTYRLPAALRPVDEDAAKTLRWRVHALGPEGIHLGESLSSPLPAPEHLSGDLSPSWAVPAAAPVELLETSPSEGESVEAPRPPIRLRWAGAVDPDRIALIVDGRDVTALSRVESESLEYQPTVDLAPGEHEAMVFIGDQTVLWRFRVETGGPEEPRIKGDGEGEPLPGGELLAGLPLDWKLDLGGEVSWVAEGESEEPDQARALSSFSLESAGEAHSAGASVDLSFRGDLEEGGSLSQESRSYALRGQIGKGRWIGLASAGFFSARSLDGSTYLNSGLSRAGAELGVEGPIGDLHAYGTYDDQTDGQVSAVQGSEQRVFAAGYGAPLPARLGTLRLLALDTADPGSEFSGLPATEGRAYGILGSFALTRAWSLDFEAADTSTERVGSDTSRGRGYRLKIRGRTGDTALGFEGWRNDSDFANPASPGLVHGSVPDRLGGSVSLLQTMGESTLSFGYRLQQSGRDPEATGPEALQHSADLGYSRPFGRVHRVTLGGSWARDSSEDPSAPPLTIEHLGLTAALSEQLGRFALTQSLARQSTRRRSEGLAPFDPDQDTWLAAFSGTGPLSKRWKLTGNLAWTRFDPAAGPTSRVLTWSLQPVWAHPAWDLSVTPWLTETRNAVSNLEEERVRQAQLLVTWGASGRWYGFGAQLAAGWREYRNLGGLPGEGDDTRIVGTLTWSWGLPRPSRGPAGRAHGSSAPALPPLRT